MVVKWNLDERSLVMMKRRMLRRMKRMKRSMKKERLRTMMQDEQFERLEQSRFEWAQAYMPL